MGKPTGFLDYPRRAPSYRPPSERVGDFRPFEIMLSEEELREQAARCMDCGVPFCHAYGCPLGNLIPDYNDAVYRGRWQEALKLLHATCSFPEFTGSVCPALCEAACTLALDGAPTICRHIELQIAEKGWKEGWIVPEPPDVKTGRTVAVIGSGPAGLAAAQRLARKGHSVTVLEKSDRIGGILQYGIPAFKLDKSLIARRAEQMRQEGVRFETGVEAGSDLSARYILKNFDAVLIASGAPKHRDIDVPGRELSGIYPAMEFLTQQTKLLYGDAVDPAELIDPKGRSVVVIGGGDTGADCVSTVIRRGCRSVTQIEVLPAPPQERMPDNPWPQWPRVLRTASAHEEGCTRLWGLLVKEFYGSGGAVKKLRCVGVEPVGRQLREIPGSDVTIEADLVLLSMGFVPYRDSPLVRQFGADRDEAGSIAVDERCRTSVPKVFAAGDAVTGASLVVRALSHGREAASAVHRYLVGGDSGGI